MLSSCGRGFERQPHGECTVGVVNFDIAARDEQPAVAQVLQTDAGRGFGLEFRAQRVRHDQAAVFDTDRDVQRIAARDRIVFHGIADQRLEREGRKAPAEVVRIDLDIEVELVGIPYFKEVTVRLGELQLLAEGDERALSVLDDNKSKEAYGLKQDCFSLAPPIIKEFLGYMGTVKGKSPLTVEEYFMDLRTFFRYMKQHRNQVPQDMPFVPKLTNVIFS